MNWMTTSKRRRGNPCTPEDLAPIEWTLPSDLLLEILARSITCTLVRSAATCKLLRRDILNPFFVRRVTKGGGIVPPCILAYLNTHDDKPDPPSPISLLHPPTSTAVSFLDGHMSPYLSRFADDLLGEHYTLASRGGLVLLRGRHVSNTLSNLCVYDLTTGHRSFLSNPPEFGSKLTGYFDSCVLLTTADGIDCSFLLFVPHLVTRYNNSNTRTQKFHIVTSACGTWAPSIMSHNTSGFLFNEWFALRRPAVVLPGGVIHWLVCNHGEILTYNVRTTEQRTINLPIHIANFKGQTYLGSYYSRDGRKLLRMLGADGFKLSVWHQLQGGDWAQEPMTIDTEEKLQSLEPDIITGRLKLSKFQCSGQGISQVFLRIYWCGSVKHRRVLLTVLDLETKEMRVQEYSIPFPVLLEVDLPSRLRSMKLFL